MKSGRIVMLAWLLLAAVVASAAAYVAPRSASPPTISLTGQCLVASRRVAEPTFAQSVILMVAHNEDGAMGLMVNRVLGTVAMQDLVLPFGIRTRNRKPVEVYLGGPVDLGRGFVLHSNDYVGAGTQKLQRGLSLSAGLDVMQAIARGRGPKQSLFLLGYAGWGPGQVDRELARGDWLLAPADETLIFSDDPKTVWQRALRHAGIPL